MRPEPFHPPTVVDSAVSAVSKTPPQTDTAETPNAAGRIERGRPHLAVAVSAPDAAIVDLLKCGRPGNIPPDSESGRIVAGPRLRTSLTFLTATRACSGRRCSR
jgi:hypothetical protein